MQRIWEQRTMSPFLIVNLSIGSTLFWSRTLSGNEWRNPWLKGNSLEATTAAWGLRAMLGARLLEEATPVVRYLLQAYLPHDPDPEVVSY